MANYLAYSELGDVRKLIEYLNDEFQVAHEQSELAAEVTLTDCHGENVGTVKWANRTAGFAFYPIGS